VTPLACKFTCEEASFNFFEVDMRSKWLAVLLAGSFLGSAVVAQNNSMYLPSPDKRWQTLIDKVQIDVETFQSSIGEGGEVGAYAWIRYVTSDKQELITANITGGCSKKDFIVQKIVSKTVAGGEKISNVLEEVPLHPGSIWEPAVSEICKRAKPWWKVW
jgi:hypothetical protein